MKNYPWGALTGRYPVGFSPNQALPAGYVVEWWESDEHYRWVKIDPTDDPNHPEVYSDVTCCRWAARRGAIAHAAKHLDHD